MVDVEAIDGALERAVRLVRFEQSDEGYWASRWRSFSLALAYGIALVHAGEPVDSPRIREICDFIEAHAHPEGGFHHCPGAVQSPQRTQEACIFLRRCRPESAALHAAERWLARSMPVPAYPSTLALRWVLEPEARNRILRHRPPPMWVRKAVWRYASRNFGGSPPPSTEDFPNGPLDWKFKLGLRLFGVFHWMDPDAIGRMTRDTDPFAPPFSLNIFCSLLAMQTLGEGRPLSRGREQVHRYVRTYIDRMQYDDGSMYYLLFASSFLLLLEVLGLDERAEQLRERIRAVDYQAGCWVTTTMCGTNVFETAMAIEALLACGVTPDDAQLQRAADWLHAARMPSGLWSWSWERSAGPTGHRDADSDDTGYALLALQATGSPHASWRAQELADLMIDLFQDENGGFGTMDWGKAVQQTHLVTKSNTSRAIRALRAMGVAGTGPAIERACDWLLRTQRQDGWWRDFWVTGPYYGTLVALEALVGLGHVELTHEAVVKAVAATRARQNPDGGWGCDWFGKPLATSQTEHTAFAMLILARYAPDTSELRDSLSRAAELLLARQRDDGAWEASYVANYSGFDGYAATHWSQFYSMMALAEVRELLA